MLLTCQQCRQFDQIAIREFGIPGVVLMENAGRGCAQEIYARFGNRSVTILCGAGNNGGDGFVIARHLHILDVEVSVLVIANKNKFSDDARTNFDILSKMNVSLAFADVDTPSVDFITRTTRLDAGTVLVDAMLGTGASGNLREPYRSAVNSANEAAVPKVAIDLPSGIRGIHLPESVAFKADLTLTFVAKKKCFEHANAQPFVGEINVINIGAPNEVFERVLTQHDPQGRNNEVT